jgi:hypothetical protein
MPRASSFPIRRAAANPACNSTRSSTASSRTKSHTFTKHSTGKCHNDSWATKLADHRADNSYFIFHWKVTAYGGDLSVKLLYEGSGPIRAEPLVLIRGNGITLMHRPRDQESIFSPGREFTVSVPTYEVSPRMN